MQDSELLREYVERNSEGAFETLVVRHSGMVYGVAMRMVRDRQVAEEIAQAVFIILARKGAGLSDKSVISGWLYRTAVLVSKEAFRAEARRQKRMEAWKIMNAQPGDESNWEKIMPVLDKAMEKLNSSDRNVLVLRFLEQQSFLQVAEAIGTTEAAAKMRTTRALEKLRSSLLKCGVGLPLSGLSAAMGSAPVLKVAPSLAAALKWASLTRPETSSAHLAAASLKHLGLLQLKVALAASMAVLAVGGLLFISFIPSIREARPHLSEQGFAPMSGLWEGTYISKQGPGSNGTAQPASLVINTSSDGSTCDIEMRTVAEPAHPAALYRFKHALNTTRDRISTVDDPQIHLADGEGLVVESLDSTRNRQWNLRFKTRHSGDEGETDCVWKMTTSGLSISRHDRMKSGGRIVELYSELILHRMNSTISPMAQTSSP